MYSSSSPSEAQRNEAVALFMAGHASWSVAQSKARGLSEQPGAGTLRGEQRQPKTPRPSPTALPQHRKEFAASLEGSAYGHRRIHHKLVKAGCQIAKKTVLKLMREMGLVCLSAGAGVTTPSSEPKPSQPRI
ncbi:IS3 family transposase [Arthrobacter sp. Marseille-P9274]|uniref:IS3 family transposase n=1 Tax=Arthrobacter sp. Marseille-P9274 TaxID=2866572 RepID=UPI0027B92E9A|nr:IS3 family transposase [Arthrobacter sp. Marseille-P9274]